MLKDFKAFIARGNVLDLAVAVIIGAAFGKIVSSLTDDVIMPVIGKIFGGLVFFQLFRQDGGGPRQLRRLADRLCRAQEGGRAAARLWRVHHGGGQFPDPCFHHLHADPRGQSADAQARDHRRRGGRARRRDAARARFATRCGRGGARTPPRRYATARSSAVASAKLVPSRMRAVSSRTRIIAWRIAQVASLSQSVQRR